jgi:hypothetical protein
MEAICSSETSGSLRTTLYYNPEDRTLFTVQIIYLQRTLLILRILKLVNIRVYQKRSTESNSEQAQSSPYNHKLLPTDALQYHLLSTT